MSIKVLIDMFKRKMLHLRLQPIRVFCFHIVSDAFNKETMWDCDWMSTAGFKNWVSEILLDYKFIPLQDAYNHIKNDRFRLKKYAVLTFDDGHSSIKGVLPWLAKNKIPVTLFVNSGILSNACSREKPMSLLTVDELHFLESRYGSILTIGNHGFSHESCNNIPFEVFKKDVFSSESFLSQFKLKIPFFAYPFGHYSEGMNVFLNSIDLVPVLCDGMKNYSDPKSIHREVV